MSLNAAAFSLAEPPRVNEVVEEDELPAPVGEAFAAAERRVMAVGGEAGLVEEPGLLGRKAPYGGLSDRWIPSCARY